MTDKDTQTLESAFNYNSVYFQFKLITDKWTQELVPKRLGGCQMQYAERYCCKSQETLLGCNSMETEGS